MGITAWIVPGLPSGMIAKRPGRRRGPPGLIIIGVTGAGGAAVLLAAYRLSGSRAAHAPFAAGVGPTELGPLA